MAKMIPIALQEQPFRLLHAIRDKKRIEVTTEFFSRKLLRDLYEDDAFPPTDYNHGDGWYDYDFLPDLFNGRSCLTNRQERKFNGIIAYSLKPYSISKRISDADTRLNEIAEMRRTITDYRRTRDVYVQYRQSCHNYSIKREKNRVQAF